MATIIRQSYIDKIEKYLGKETIIVLVGQRRVGKSCMMKMIRDRKKADDCNNIIFIDKEKREFDCIQTYQDLNDYIGEHFLSDKHNYILIDEIQDIREFERSIRSYRTEPNTDIIITGSNARMLSNELSTLIGGRYKEIYIQSLSYNEFLEFHQLSDNDEALALYIQYGGLPGLAKIGLEEDDAREYQMDIYHTVLLKDVIMRNQIRNVPFLENLVRFLADNTGKLISANSIAKYMKSQGESITSTAIINYISFLCEAYILHKVNRYDIHGKRIFETNDKFYFEEVRSQYDYVLIDCMPSLGILTVNALACADSVLVPVQAAYLPVKGLQQLIKTIYTVRRLNNNLSIEGILFTMVDRRTVYAKEIVSEVNEVYGKSIPIFPIEIPMSVRASETSQMAKTIYDYDPKRKAASAYSELTREVLEHGC